MFNFNSKSKNENMMTPVPDIVLKHLIQWDILHNREL
ncbi:hypothetical protein ZPR_2661 [Zunongwangia profunda SM-A87]|uniref:Uncharacterized protein n=1 Tax=Zunongwangia profunda (strain DSM 18752 / CCTCC AB 206139 / SM-A87) TaxID=655815 RepID=D5BF85_ZUNPS|nr:hypothetical protein ZPR_2661 [Zunongwangia profunda SM-A87]